jgi:hypothetical protein
MCCMSVNILPAHQKWDKRSPWVRSFTIPCLVHHCESVCGYLRSNTMEQRDIQLFKEFPALYGNWRFSTMFRSFSYNFPQPPTASLPLSFLLYTLILTSLQRKWDSELNGSEHSPNLISPYFLCECNFNLLLSFPVYPFSYAVCNLLVVS